VALGLWPRQLIGDKYKTVLGNNKRCKTLGVMLNTRLLYNETTLKEGTLPVLLRICGSGLI